MKRIAIACGHLSTGGMPRTVLNTIKALRDDYEFCLFYDGNDNAHDELERQVLNVADASAFGDAEAFISFCKTVDPDLIMYNDWYPSPRPKGISSVEYVHSGAPPTATGYADRYLCIADHQMEWFQGLNVQRIYTPVDNIEFDAARFNADTRAALRASYNFDSDEKIILCVGILAPHKNQAELSKIWGPDIGTLVFVGPLAGNFRWYWKPLADKWLGDRRVRFVGGQPDVASFMSIADVVINCSAHEGCCMSNLEAAAMKKPLVLSDIPGNRQAFSDDDALIRPVDGSYLTAVSSVLTNDGHERIENAYKRVMELHSLGAYRKQMTKIFDESILGTANGDINKSNELNQLIAEMTKAVPNPGVYFPTSKKGDEQIEKFGLPTRIPAGKVGDTAPQTYIEIASTALGDSLAWTPYILDFAEKTGDEILVVNRYADLFKRYIAEQNYENLSFVSEQPPNLKFDRKLVFGFDFSQMDNRLFPLQCAAVRLLGLPYVEKRLHLERLAGDRQIDGDYVCIAPRSTMRGKQWNYIFDQGWAAWQSVVDWLNAQGLTVVWISKEECNLENVIDKSGDIPLIDRITDLTHAEFFIGLQAGLSWLAWSAGCYVFMISGIAQDWFEFQSNCTHIGRNDVCRGCFNEALQWTADWEWCPRQQMFQCTTLISPDMVIQTIKESDVCQNISSLTVTA